MKISLEKLKMHSWFEDEDGNIYPNTPSLDLPKDKEYFTYHSVFPCTYTEELHEYCIHESTAYKGFGVCDLVFIVFLVLKLTRVIHWSWWWVTAPLWIPFIVAIIIVVITALIAKRG